MIRSNDVPESLQGEEREYFLATGKYPPFVSPDASLQDIKERIENMRLIAESSTDREQAEILICEIGYLSRKQAQL